MADAGANDRHGPPGAQGLGDDAIRWWRLDPGLARFRLLRSELALDEGPEIEPQTVTKSLRGFVLGEAAFQRTIGIPEPLEELLYPAELLDLFVEGGVGGITEIDLAPSVINEDMRRRFRGERILVLPFST